MFALPDLLERRDLSSDAKLVLIHMDRCNAKVQEARDVAHACGLRTDDVLKANASLQRLGVTVKHRGAPGTQVELIDGTPWKDCLRRLGPAIPVYAPRPGFDPSDQTPIGDPEDPEDGPATAPAAVEVKEEKKGKGVKK